MSATGRIFPSVLLPNDIRFHRHTVEPYQLLKQICAKKKTAGDDVPKACCRLHHDTFPSANPGAHHMVRVSGTDQWSRLEHHASLQDIEFQISTCCRIVISTKFE
tara:strand:+ start:133 stop:447 length:315 start_codon:yes stop_codon:yes gene_type:complete